ncbi:MAG: hypothetical protein RR405_06035 [Clostridia bacterium]
MRSCKPYWLYLIIQGVKIIEICKSKPIAKDWDKTVYLYCSQDKKSFNRIPQEDREWFNRFLGKVVCEFVCDGIMRMDAIFMSCNIKYHCVQADELYKYCNGKPLHGWKISKLKIYDEPKELSEFGISRPPQSWCYCEELEENENEAAG